MFYAMLTVDRDLIERCNERDRRAQSELYRLVYSTLMSVATRYRNERSEAKALVNLAFLKILSGLPAKRDEVPLEAWCRKITINTAINEHKKNDSRKRTEEITDRLEYSDSAPTDLNGVESIIETERMEDMLHRLPVASRNVFNLFAIDGYAHNEISQMLGISIGTSKWHVSHARQELRKMLIVQPYRLANS